MMFGICSEVRVIVGGVMRRAIVLGALGSVVLSASAAANPAICPGPYWPVNQTPGLTVGDSYINVKSRVPKSANCDDASQRGCEFRDRHGYTNRFGNLDHQDGPTKPKSRILFDKVAVREQGAKLPYGVVWADSFEDVFRRLKVLGIKATSVGKTEIEVGTCGGPDADWIFTNFAFDDHGRLVRMRQFVSP